MCKYKIEYEIDKVVITVGAKTRTEYYRFNSFIHRQEWDFVKDTSILTRAIVLRDELEDE